MMREIAGNFSANIEIRNGDEIVRLRSFKKSKTKTFWKFFLYQNFYDELIFMLNILQGRTSNSQDNFYKLKEQEGHKR